MRAAALFLTRTAFVVIIAALRVLTDGYVEMDNVLTVKKRIYIHIHDIQKPK